MNTADEMSRALDYIKHIDTVEGWCSREEASLILAVHISQRERGLTGDILEIGVWRGKSGILFCQLIDPRTEFCILNDSFDINDSPDEYGEGNLAVLEENLSRWFGGSSEAVLIEPYDSTQLLQRIARFSGRIRISHVDGSHRYENALNDMLMCAGLMIRQGCMIIDDAFNIYQPSVNQALNDFLKGSPFTPFAVGFNKAFLCHEDYYDEYFGIWETQCVASILSDFDVVLAHSLQRPILFFGKEVAALTTKKIYPHATPVAEVAHILWKRLPASVKQSLRSTAIMLLQGNRPWRLASTRFANLLRRLLARSRAKRGSREVISDYLENTGIKKLHVGTGYNRLEGWLNSDLNPVTSDIVFLDATQRFPFDDCLFDYVYSEHLIEHLTCPEGLSFLAECYRVLKPGGKLRTATPDLAFLVELYRSDKTELQVEYIKYTKSNDEEYYWVDGAEDTFVINNYFRYWGHKFIYDEKSLSGALAKTGFIDITRCDPSSSDDVELEGLENSGRMPDGFLELETLAIECTKRHTPP